MDEIILMRKLKKKDERALGKIIDLYSAYITCIVWELLHKKGTKEDIEEVVADTFISLQIKVKILHIHGRRMDLKENALFAQKESRKAIFGYIQKNCKVRRKNVKFEYQ